MAFWHLKWLRGKDVIIHPLGMVNGQKTLRSAKL